MNLRRMVRTFLANFRERRKAEVQLRRIPLLRTSVNKAVPLAAAVSGWADRRLAGSRLALAVGAHFVPSAADVHVAPAPGAVLRGVVEGPAASLVTTGLQSIPLPLPLRPAHLRQQPRHHALGRTIPGSGLQGRS